MSKVNDNPESSGFTDINEHDEELVKGHWGVIKRHARRQASVEYAAKVFNTDKLTARDLQNLERDVKICRLLNHPNIVRIRASIVEGKDHYLVFELVTGGELLESIAARTNYSEVDASLYIQQLVESIYYCHRNNIIHKEIKPENLLLASEQESSILKFADFGLAIKVPNNRVAQFSFSGTLEYLSPEVLRNDVCGKPVDMWGCGVILYLLLVGYAPFRDEDQSKLVRKIKAADYNFPSPEWDNVTHQAKDLVRKMFTQNPESRITAQEALQHPWINQRETIASQIHRQDTVDCLKKFNEKPKRKNAAINAVVGTRVLSEGRSLLENKENKDGNGVRESGRSGWTADDYQTRAKVEIIRLTEQILKAKFDCDFEAYRKLVSTDMSCFAPETCGNLVKGRDFHKFFLENNSTKRSKSTIILDPRVTLLGDDGACIAYVNLTRNLTSNDQVAVEQVQETQVWQRANGAWRMIHFHRSEHLYRTSNSDS